jgi:hypothetical protein
VSYPAQPYPLLKRIPEDQPLVVRHSRKKRFGLVGIMCGVLSLFLLCIVGVGMAGDGANVAALLAVWLILTVFLVAMLSLIVWFTISGGPVLAAGPAGLWIKTRPTRGQAVWLPWEHIELISRRRWSFDKLLVVKPRDNRLQNNLGVFTAVDASISRAFYGSGFTATLNFADKKEDEILQAIAYYAAGRVPLA